MEPYEAPIILMADDDTDDCMLASDAFKASATQGMIRFVENGVELLNYLSHSSPIPSLILLDLNMPLKNGREALKEIKSIPAFQDIPIVVLTTSQEKDDFIYCMETGAKSFITKPASFSEWVEIMRSLADSCVLAK